MIWIRLRRVAGKLYSVHVAEQVGRDEPVIHLADMRGVFRDVTLDMTIGELLRIAHEKKSGPA